MFTKILIANRGDQPQSGAAAKLNCMAHAVRAGDFTPMEKAYV
jgi:hypothetical protein